MNVTTRLRIFLAVLLPFTVFISGCDFGGSDADEESVDHEFTLNVTPSESSKTSPGSKVSDKELNGFSFFVDTEDIENVDAERFAIYLSDDESLSEENASDGLFGVIGRESAQPSTSGYTITDESDGDAAPSEFVGALYEEMGSSQNEPIYVLNSGSLDITTSTDDKVSGTIDASATAYTVTNTTFTKQPVEITGSFTAKNLENYLPFNQYIGGPAQ